MCTMLHMPMSASHEGLNISMIKSQTVYSDICGRNIYNYLCLLQVRQLNTSLDPKWRRYEVIYHSPMGTQGYYLPHVGTSLSDRLMQLNSFGESDWLVRGPLAAVESSCQCTVCVWYSKRWKNWVNRMQAIASLQHPTFLRFNLF